MLAHPVVQRCHRRASVGAGTPLQVPSVAVSFEPTLGVPEMAGRVVLLGGSGVGSAGAITGVCAEIAVAEPTVLRAVTTTCTFRPTSAVSSRYVEAVAPAIRAHEVAEQRCHSRTRVGGGVPRQVPVVEVRMEPTFGVPVRVGGSAASGREVTGAVRGEAATARPDRFAAVTTTRRRRPASAAPGT